MEDIKEISKTLTSKWVLLCIVIIIVTVSAITISYFLFFHNQFIEVQNKSSQLDDCEQCLSTNPACSLYLGKNNSCLPENSDETIDCSKCNIPSQIDTNVYANYETVGGLNCLKKLPENKTGTCKMTGSTGVFYQYSNNNNQTDFCSNLGMDDDGKSNVNKCLQRSLIDKTSSKGFCVPKSDEIDLHQSLLCGNLNLTDCENENNFLSTSNNDFSNPLENIGNELFQNIYYVRESKRKESEQHLQQKACENFARSVYDWRKPKNLKSILNFDNTTPNKKIGTYLKGHREDLISCQQRLGEKPSFITDNKDSNTWFFTQQKDLLNSIKENTNDFTDTEVDSIKKII